jgi:hypothetical protein
MSLSMRGEHAIFAIPVINHACVIRGDKWKGLGDGDAHLTAVQGELEIRHCYTSISSLPEQIPRTTFTCSFNHTLLSVIGSVVMSSTATLFRAGLTKP